MERKKITEKYIFDSQGRVCGKEITEEFYSEYDMSKINNEQVVDIEPETPKLNWEDPNEVTLYDTWDQGGKGATDGQ